MSLKSWTFTTALALTSICHADWKVQLTRTFYKQDKVTLKDNGTWIERQTLGQEPMTSEGDRPEASEVKSVKLLLTIISDDHNLKMQVFLPVEGFDKNLNYIDVEKNIGGTYVWKTQNGREEQAARTQVTRFYKNLLDVKIFPDASTTKVSQGATVGRAFVGNDPDAAVYEGMKWAADSVDRIKSFSTHTVWVYDQLVSVSPQAQEAQDRIEKILDNELEEIVGHMISGIESLSLLKTHTDEPLQNIILQVEKSALSPLKKAGEQLQQKDMGQGALAHALQQLKIKSQGPTK